MSQAKVPMVDLTYVHGELRKEIDAAIASVIDSGRFVMGPEVVSFEKEVAEFSFAKDAIGVSSGTDALLVALMGLDIGPGDEVVTSAFTFFATAGVIARLGAKPVFADIDPESFTLCPNKASDKIGSKTKAIMPVNLYGRLASLPAGDLPIVEDSAQSLGCGAPRGIASCISFFPTKNLGAMGDAGAVLTNDEEFADKIRRLRTHGARPKYFHAMIGGNFRIDAMQAAILRVKMRRLQAWNQMRRDNAEGYRRLFSQIDLPGLQLAKDSPEHIYHQFTLRTSKRDALRAFLAEAGVSTEIYYPQPLHLQKCFADLGYKLGDLPETEAAANESLSLPIYPGLSTKDQEYIVSKISDFLKSSF